MALDAISYLATPNMRVISRIRAHHGELARGLKMLTNDVLIAASGGVDVIPARDRLLTWYRTELLPHAAAEEQALYVRGADLEPARLLVDVMLAEHTTIATLVNHLAEVSAPVEVAATAAAAQAVFAVHLTKENDALLPALDTAGIDLGAALEGMHAILGGHQGDPDEHATPGELDARSLPHGQRHETIFAKLDELEPGEALVLVNDHDPEPLSYQLAALHPGVFSWEYVERGPQVWRVRIGRVAATVRP